MSIARDDRLQMRLGPDLKRTLEQAAAESHLSVSAFVLQAAAERAGEVLAERGAIRLSPAAAARFEDALSRPGTVNRRLAKALGRPRRFSWLD